jgi:murein DD-endopeptidase MepM/ murein hydrolase activator NlpD
VPHRPGLFAGIFFTGLLCAAPASAQYPEALAYKYRLRATHREPAWVLPLDAAIGSPFGPRWGRFHEGIDIEGWAETRVRAARPGVVTQVGWLQGYEGYGLVAMIRHRNGFVTMYAHLAKAFVRPGDRVAGGQLIAQAGCTGSCTGVHLHFQMWLRGKLVDPLRFLGRRAFTR